MTAEEAFQSLAPKMGKTEAAAALAEALHAFDHGNDKLEKALELAKQA